MSSISATHFSARLFQFLNTKSISLRAAIFVCSFFAADCLRRHGSSHSAAQQLASVSPSRAGGAGKVGRARVSGRRRRSHIVREHILATFFSFDAATLCGAQLNWNVRSCEYQMIQKLCRKWFMNMQIHCSAVAHAH